MKLIETLEDDDDVQNVYSNADISAETWRSSPADGQAPPRTIPASRPAPVSQGAEAAKTAAAQAQAAGRVLPGLEPEAR